MSGSQKEQSLQALQRWMQSVITHPDGIEAGIESTAAQEEIPAGVDDVESVITRSLALTSVDRLGVYGNAYYARLLDCLREMFSSLVYALGDDTFDAFAFGYLQQYPPSSYTLNNLADHFVDYLIETRPDTGENAEDGIPEHWPDFIIDLARMEWTIDQVFDGPGMEKRRKMSPQDLAGIPPDDWHRARLVPAPCLRLMRVRFPVSQYFADVRNDLAPEIPLPSESFVAISRRDYVVRRYELSKPQFKLLDALYSGATVGEGIEQLAAELDDLDDLARCLGDWFRAWGEEGFFQSVELDGD